MRHKLQPTNHLWGHC